MCQRLHSISYYTLPRKSSQVVAFYSNSKHSADIADLADGADVAHPAAHAALHERRPSNARLRVLRRLEFRAARWPRSDQRQDMRNLHPGIRPHALRAVLQALHDALQCRRRPTKRRFTPRSKRSSRLDFPTKRSSPRGRTKVAKVGPLRARLKSAKVRPQAASHKKVFALHKKVFAPRADQSC